MRRFYASLKRISFILVPIVVVLIAGFFLFYLFPRNDEQSLKNLKFEIIKFLAQLIIIVLLGGILVHEFNRGRDRAKATNEFRKTLFNDLLRAYFETKKARRILDAHVITNPNTNSEEIPYSVYAEQIKILNDAQLKFEFYMYQLGVFRYIFRNIVDLKAQARIMESYLNDLIDEYKKLKVPGGATQLIQVSHLPKLQGFLHTKTFKANFSLSFHLTIELIQKEIPSI